MQHDGFKCLNSYHTLHFEEQEYILRSKEDGTELLRWPIQQDTVLFDEECLITDNYIFNFRQGILYYAPLENIRDLRRVDLEGYTYCVSAQQNMFLAKNKLVDFASRTLWDIVAKSSEGQTIKVHRSQFQWMEGKMIMFVSDGKQWHSADASALQERIRALPSLLPIRVPEPRAEDPTVENVDPITERFQLRRELEKEREKVAEQEGVIEELRKKIARTHIFVSFQLIQLLTSRDQDDENGFLR